MFSKDNNIKTKTKKNNKNNNNLIKKPEIKLPDLNIKIKPFTFKSNTNITTKKKNKKPKTIKQLCEIYKTDITGKPNLPLYNSCKINQYCRKYKCKNIDKKFKEAQIRTLGTNYNTLLMTSLHSKCPATMLDKNRKRCYNSAMYKFYKDNNLNNIYDKVLECDKTTCAKEKNIFNTNLFRLRTKGKGKKNIRIPKPLNIEDLPDKEMIEIN